MDFEEAEALKVGIGALGFGLILLRRILGEFFVPIRNRGMGEENDEVDCNCIEEGWIEEKRILIKRNLVDNFEGRR